ncbi:CRIB domain-containing protein RIC7, partial [Cucurbita argyrosperma subsp. argyrosperma]
GYPTDVRHVAHIGWDGPSVTPPSWMNEFKKAPSFSSTPFTLPAPAHIKGDVPVKWVAEDRCRRGDKGSNSAARSTADVAKPSRHPSSIESPTARERSERHKARRSSKGKDSSDEKESNNESPTLSLPGIPRTGRKKTSRTKTQVAGTHKSALRLEDQCVTHLIIDEPVA